MIIHVTDIKTGDVLKEDVFNSYGLHILSKNVTMTAKEISKLLQHQIDYVTITKVNSLQIDSLEAFDELERTLESTASPKWVPQVKPIYDSIVNNVENLFLTAKKNNKIDVEEATKTFEPLLDNLHLERDVVSMLLLLNNQSSYTYQHSVQVGMLSYYLANWLGYSDEEAVRIGNAGFLHDIGKSKIDEAILNKPSKLTDDEYNLVKQHTIFGYEIIKNSIDDEDIALGALQHHERVNGVGYPYGLKGDEISTYGRIIAVCDIYSAMISSRIYQKERDLLFVLKEIERLSYEQLDPVIAQTFIKHMIPNFIGKRVKISDNREGTIIMTHPTEFFRPLIKIDEQFIDLTIDRSFEIIHVYF